MLRRDGGHTNISEFIFEIKVRSENIWVKTFPCGQNLFNVSMWGWNYNKNSVTIIFIKIIWIELNSNALQTHFKFTHAGCFKKKKKRRKSVIF